jgi:hypothetical protein
MRLQNEKTLILITANDDVTKAKRALSTRIVFSIYSSSITITEAESKEKHGVWDPMPELTLTSAYVDSKTMGMGNPMLESTLFSSQGLGTSPQSNEHFRAGIFKHYGG